MSNKSKKIFLTLGLVFSVFILIILFLFVKNSGGIKTSPIKTNNIAGPIVIKSNSPIKKGSGSYKITPSAAGNLQIIDNYIVFWPDHDNSFLNDVEYNAEFKGFKTESGTDLGVFNFSFKVLKNNDYDKLQKEVLSKYGRLEDTGNPLLEKLPYKKDFSFRISYVLNKQPEPKYNQDSSGIIDLLGTKDNWKEKKSNYIVQIETIVIQSRNQDNQSYIAEVKQARQDALKWITNQGVDPSKDINIIFIPSDEELTNTSIAPEQANLPEGDV